MRNCPRYPDPPETSTFIFYFIALLFVLLLLLESIKPPVRTNKQQKEGEKREGERE
jgi:hypothetical protein